MDQQNEHQQFMKQWNEIYKMKKEMAVKKRKMDEEVLEKEHKIMDEIMKGMKEKDEKIAVLERENFALKMKMAKMDATLKAENLSISWPVGLPAELLNVLFGSLPLKNAFSLLTKMPNGLLARHVQKMINGIKEAMKNNKLNEEDCGPKLGILEDGHAAKHSVPHRINCIRAILSILSFNLEIINRKIIASYFEIEILNIIGDESIEIGFCEQQFPLEGKCLGWNDNSNSIGIWNKRAMYIDGSFTELENKIGNDYFKKGDLVGIGIINQPNSEIECFATWNGKLLGKHALPPKFAKLQLFPAANLARAGESIRANFGKEKWQFKEFGSVLK